MPKHRTIAALLFVLKLMGGASLAFAATDEAREEGVAFRLVAERAGEDGRFRAALRVDLAPGWKTYWLDPGEAGIPPSLDFSNSAGIDGMVAHFPAPHRFDDGVSKSNVYSEPMAIALEGRADGRANRLDLKLTLGICRDVCIPASVDLRTSLESAEAAPAAVISAFAALPKASTAAEGVVAAALSADGTSLAVTVRPEALAEKADLFAAASGGWYFGPPSSVTRNGGAATFTLPVTGKPRREEAPPRIDAVIAGPAGAWRADGLPAAAGKG